MHVARSGVRRRRRRRGRDEVEREDADREAPDQLLPRRERALRWFQGCAHIDSYLGAGLLDAFSHASLDASLGSFLVLPLHVAIRDFEDSSTSRRWFGAAAEASAIDNSV